MAGAGKKYFDGQLGEPGEGLHEYVAGLNGARLVVFAPSQSAASQMVLAAWKPFKKDKGYLWVKLVQLYGADEPVLHVADF